ncbi:MAG: hypothetical protein DRH10_07400 [Deltaproteobacteria bacterium]|nr:MAG: hypothetical protein DRH10_07400 [Deltaproteobacteria bacterium]
MFSTFLGGSGQEGTHSITVDGDGYVYVAGATLSADFPTTSGAYDGDYDSGLCGDPFIGFSPCWDAFVLKLDMSQSGAASLVYATFLGADGADDRARDIAVDAMGNIYIKGATYADQFPVHNAYQTTRAGDQDVFIAKFNPAGNTLLYSTYLGGSGYDEVYAGLVADDAGNVYLTGYTWSADFPITSGAYQETFAGEMDVFAAKLDTTQSGAASLVYSTYLGGDYKDFGMDMDVDAAGYAYLTGYTKSDDFPTIPGAYRTERIGPCDIFVAKLSPAGDSLVYSTLIGGSGDFDRSHGIAVDGDGCAYVVGDTKSTDYPTTPSAYQMDSAGSFDIVVTKFNADGSELMYSTYLGGGSGDYGWSIALDGDDNAYLTGYTASEDFPTQRPYQAELAGGTDAIVVVFDTNGSGNGDDLLYSTYLGGSDDDWYGLDYLDMGADIATEDGDAYVVGFAESEDFPTTPNGYQTTHAGGGRDVFVSRLSVISWHTISGRVTDAAGQPLAGVRITANETFSATTDAGGVYTITSLFAGSYTLTPERAGYFFSPETRTVTLPPDASDQDFVAVHIRKESAVPTHQAVGHGQPLTYTLRLVYPDAREVALYDAVPTYTTYISGSLRGPVGAVYDAGVISGTLNLAANTPLSLTFAVRVGVSGTVRFSPPIVNRACVYPVGGGLDDCEWSNEVRHPTYLWYLYLPLVTRDGGT